jgi:hypothetical protein
VIARTPIEWNVEVEYPLSDIVSSDIPHAGIYRAVSSFFECWDLSLVRDNQYVIQFQLIEVEVLVQIEVSDSCSDVQKLFSVIGNNVRNMMYKKGKISAKKYTK